MYSMLNPVYTRNQGLLPSRCNLAALGKIWGKLYRMFAACHDFNNDAARPFADAREDGPAPAAVASTTRDASTRCRRPSSRRRPRPRVSRRPRRVARATIERGRVGTMLHHLHRRRRRRSAAAAAASLRAAAAAASPSPRSPRTKSGRRRTSGKISSTRCSPNTGTDARSRCDRDRARSCLCRRARSRTRTSRTASA